MARKRAEQTQPAETAVPEAAAAEAPQLVREPGEEGDAPEQQWGPNPRQWAHNNQVGVALRSRREPYQAELVFNDKPPQEVIDYVKQEGFRWNGQEKLWVRPDNYATQAQDRLTAQRTYAKVVEMLCESKGLEASGERTPF